jgi:hypothetical protein
MTVRTIVLLVVCLLSSVSLVTGADDPRASIIGTWRLISFKTQTADGTVTDLYGTCQCICYSRACQSATLSIVSNVRIARHERHLTTIWVIGVDSRSTPRRM